MLNDATWEKIRETARAMDAERAWSLTVQVETAGREVVTARPQTPQDLWDLVMTKCRDAPHGVVAVYVELDR